MVIKFIDIKLDNVRGITTKVKTGDNHELIGTIQIEVLVTPAIIARLLNLQKQGIPLFAAVGTDQLSFDLRIEEIDSLTGEIKEG